MKKVPGMKKVTKDVQVHVCYAIELSEQKPKKCRCRLWVTREQSEDLVCSGMARHVVRYDRAKPYEDDRQICLLGKAGKTPRCATIEKAHLERAYVDGDIEEQRRVNVYGLLTLLERIKAGKKFVPSKFEPEGGRETDLNIPIFSFVEDQRTKGGYTR
jgi:hypothetical protein